MIAVTDNGSDKVPVCGLLDPEDVAGRGLGLVEVIAERWDTAAGVAAALSGSSFAGRAHQAPLKREPPSALTSSASDLG